MSGERDRRIYIVGAGLSGITIAGEIRQKVEELHSLFPTGLIISPSHEAVLPDIPPANVDAIFN